MDCAVIMEPGAPSVLVCLSKVLAEHQDFYNDCCIPVMVMCFLSSPFTLEASYIKGINSDLVREE
jgi:hypothetical protein